MLTLVRPSPCHHERVPAEGARAIRREEARAGLDGLLGDENGLPSCPSSPSTPSLAAFFSPYKILTHLLIGSLWKLNRLLKARTDWHAWIKYLKVWKCKNVPEWHWHHTSPSSLRSSPALKLQTVILIFFDFAASSLLFDRQEVEYINITAWKRTMNLPEGFSASSMRN